MMEFCGFSSEEDEEEEVSNSHPLVAPDPVPPDQIQDLPPFLPTATKEATQPNLIPILHCLPFSPPTLPPVSSTFQPPTGQHSSAKEETLARSEIMATAGREDEHGVVDMETEEVELEKRSSDIEVVDDEKASTASVPKPPMEAVATSPTSLPCTPLTDRRNLPGVSPDTVMPMTAPRGRGGDRGGGRSKLLLPFGCEVFLTESGIENFICSCQTTFTEKKNLLRHHQICDSNKEMSTTQPTLPGCKRRRSGTTAEYDDALVEVNQAN